ncbi:MFS transporter (plasmid) [Rhizobium acidisoli]|uniref:MFS transporter n=1 Tax=Rhizobium acidisoli TaxID=1538158 RepID=A0AAE5WT19_9HYPH|nr:MFS transporter [Rhizobium acidisoli]KPH05317.1 MFS transporter [Rhizobium acidisoli]QAS81907.1 MFS transporter [Rhizobium acidisoli]
MLEKKTIAAYGSDFHEIDSGYAWWRLVLTLILGTVACVGNWSVVVLLPTLQVEFDTVRGGASLPYTCTMLGFAFGGVLMGRLADRVGIVVPVLVGALLLCIGYITAALTGNIWQFAACSLIIGFGSAAGFSPLISDLSHWFNKHRGLAVAFAASGSYLSGAVWPLVIEHFLTSQGWRATHVGIGIFVPLVMVPIGLLLRRRLQTVTYAKAEALTEAARNQLGLSANALQAVLVVAGFACCMAMSMPQVHIVAYCGDLGYGVAIGTQIIALMLGLGVVSRLASGAVADRIGAGPMLILGSSMQAAALLLYLFFNSQSSLYVISGLFGLFQGGIVPMYAVIIRKYLPPREAGIRISLVLMATVLGMACGGLAAGYIFDATGSYRLAFLHGFLWNCVNLALVTWLILWPWLRRRQKLPLSETVAKS